MLQDFGPAKEGLVKFELNLRQGGNPVKCGLDPVKRNLSHDEEWYSWNWEVSMILNRLSMTLMQWSRPWSWKSKATAGVYWEVWSDPVKKDAEPEK